MVKLHWGYRASGEINARLIGRIVINAETGQLPQQHMYRMKMPYVRQLTGLTMHGFIEALL
ncbi:MAG: hypothetical protein MUD01_11720 [Chloroflexaceae bacterium]|nr:hypothetical protein [Chloroflexaceae bacterium]